MLRTRISTCLLAGTLSLCLSASAFGGSKGAPGGGTVSHSYGHHNGGAGQATLDLTIRGHIKPRCSLHLDDRQIHTEITDAPGSITVGFDVDCNQRLAVSLRSRNGALVHTQADNWISSPGFADRIPYGLEFSVSVDGAQSVRVDSTDIANAPRGGSVGVIPFHARGDLTLDWSTDLPPLGGRYGDVIEIRVTGEGGRNGHP